MAIVYVGSLRQTAGDGVSLARGMAGLHLLDCTVESIQSSESTSATGFSNYRQAARCYVGTVQASAGGGAGFRPVGNSSLTVDCSTGGSTLNIGVDLEGTNGAVVRGCRLLLFGTGVGIACGAGTRHRLEDNTISNASTGISAFAPSGGLMVRNRVTNCTFPIVFPTATWQVGPIINAMGNITSVSPWANFTD